jgi:hypothetical protein
MIDIWLETASITSSGRVDVKSASRNARVRAVSSSSRPSVSRATAQASGHSVANQLVIRRPVTLWPGSVSEGPQ